MRRRRYLKRRRARWRRGARLAELRPEVYSDPEFRALTARLKIAVHGLDHEEAAKWLLEIGRPTPKSLPSRRAG